MTDTANHERPVGPETRNIFLDTEVFRSNGHNLSTEIMTVLGAYLADEVFVLHTTDVTLREVSRQTRALESKLVKDHNKVVRDLTRWNNRYFNARHRLPVPDPLTEPVEPSNAFRDFEQKLRHEWNAREHSAADLQIGPVLDRYFSRQAPFDEKGGKGFADASALLALQKWCADAGESIYVVSRDKAVQRAVKNLDHLVAIKSLDDLFPLVTAAQDHDIAATISATFDEPPLLDDLQEALSANIDCVGGCYDGDKYGAHVLGMEIEEIEEIEDVTVLRVDEDRVSCVAHVRLSVSAEIDYHDISYNRSDKEGEYYVDADYAVAEIRDSITARILVQLERGDHGITLSSAQFGAEDLVVTDDLEDVYYYD